MKLTRRFFMKALPAAPSVIAQTTQEIASGMALESGFYLPQPDGGGGASSGSDSGWMLDELKRHKARLIGLSAWRDEARARHSVTRLDADLAVSVSLSLSARIRIQRERDLDLLEQGERRSILDNIAHYTRELGRLA